MPSPFPGMDPYLEDPARWPNVHLSLIAAMRDMLMDRVRPRYVVRADERIYVADEDERVIVRPDFAILGPHPAPGPSRAAAHASVETAVPVVIPTVMGMEHRERFLNILVPDSGELVAVIEILSPTNKRSEASEGRKAYVAKRRQVLHSAAHLIEIDLLRGGARVPMARPLPAADYYAIVAHADRRPRCDVFPIALRDRLPVVPIPLRGDETVPLDLQALLDTVYARAGYDLDVDYGRAPVPPLSPEDEAWAAVRVREHRSSPR